MNPYDFFDKIYCINLDSRPDRWALAQVEFEKAGILEKVIRQKGQLESGNPSYGNHLSHASCIRDALRNSAQNVLIFEDDIEWLNDPLLFKRVLPDLVDWDLLYLGVNTERDCYQVSRHLARLSFAYSTHAYAINRNMFERMIELNEDPNTVHNDVRMCEEIIPNFKCFQTIPLLAGQRSDYSDIQNTFISSNQVFIKRFEEHLKPMWFPDTEPTAVTFVVPTMGRPTLKRAIDSITHQYDWDWKAEVMFDGREPNLTVDDSHVTIRSCDRKNHAGLVRNEAMKHVTTEWIAFVDDDDWIDPDYVNLIKRYSNYDIVIFTYKDATNGNTQPPLGGDQDFKSGNVGISFAIRTDFLIKHNIQFEAGCMEDYDFLDKCRQAGAKYYLTHQIKYHVGGRGEWRENV